MHVVAKKSSLSSKYWKSEPLAISASRATTLRLPAEKPRCPNSAIAVSRMRRRLASGRLVQVSRGTATSPPSGGRGSRPGPAGRFVDLELDLRAGEEVAHLRQGRFLPFVERLRHLAEPPGLQSHLILHHRQRAQADQRQTTNAAGHEIRDLQCDVAVIADAD